MDLDSVTLLEINAFNIWQLAVRMPPTGKLFDEISNPKPGDLVLEVTSMHAKGSNGFRLGRLLRKAQEPMQGYDDPNCSAYKTMEEVVYIELPEGKEMRWTNARFIKVYEGFIST